MAQGAAGGLGIPEKAGLGRRIHLMADACAGGSWRAARAYSSVTPAAFTTFAHFSKSALIVEENSAGVPGAAVDPSAANRLLISSVFRMRTISVFSRPRIATGVPAGATIPYHVEDS